MPPTILLVDDHEIVRQGLRQILEGWWQICGEAVNGEEAVAKTVELRPDLVLMDISMPRLNGIEATRQIRLLGIPTKIVIFSMHDSVQIASQAKAAGADGCLVKSSPVDELLNEDDGDPRLTRLLQALEDALGHQRRQAE